VELCRRPPEKNAALPSGTRNDAPASSSKLRARRDRWQFGLVNRANFQIADVFHFEIN
jgi:hypothetical protein